MTSDPHSEPLILSLKALAGLGPADRRAILGMLAKPVRRRMNDHLRRLRRARRSKTESVFPLQVYLFERGVSAALVAHLVGPAPGRESGPGSVSAVVSEFVSVWSRETVPATRQDTDLPAAARDKSPNRPANFAAKGAPLRFPAAPGSQPLRSEGRFS